MRAVRGEVEMCNEHRCVEMANQAVYTVASTSCEQQPVAHCQTATSLQHVGPRYAPALLHHHGSTMDLPGGRDGGQVDSLSRE